jgi:uncharacterized membrane protein
VNASPAESATSAESIAGLLAAIAIFAALFSLAYRPVRIDPFAIVIALIAAGIGGRHSRLASFAVFNAAACFVVGMIIAILTKHPLY